MGTRESLNGRKNVARRKVKNGEKSPWGQWALSIQPKIPVISVGTSNGTDHFGLVPPEYSGPALKVVLFDRSGHFGRLDRNVPFHLTKLLSPVPLFCILLARTITKRAVARGGTGMYRSIEHGKFPEFQTGIFVEWKAPNVLPD